MDNLVVVHTRSSALRVAWTMRLPVEWRLELWARLRARVRTECHGGLRGEGEWLERRIEDMGKGHAFLIRIFGFAKAVCVSFCCTRHTEEIRCQQKP